MHKKSPLPLRGSVCGIVWDLRGASLRLALRATLRITSCNSPFGPHIVRSNLLQANLVGREKSFPTIF